VAPPLENVVAAALVLLPAVLLFFSGPTYHHATERVVGSIAFAVLALAFLLQPLGNSLVLDSTGQAIYNFFIQNRVYIVTLGLAFAVFDLLTTRTPKHRDRSRH
jgi:asparagine N-glycosylation enzyme membrane subunit Stt3